MTEPPSPTSWNFALNRRRFIGSAVGGLGALALGACAPSIKPGPRGGRPTVRLPQGATGFPTPFAANADFGFNQMSLLYDSLLWKDGAGNMLPWLAQSFESSADHLTFTFKLRDNLKWSDGRPLTADDVVFTFEYFATQKTLGPPVIIQPPQGIAKVSANGPQTVVVALASPLVTFPEQVAGALAIVPRHIWSSVADPTVVDDRKLLVGSGAYRLDSYDGDGGAMRFLARDDYFLGTPFVKEISENAVEEAAQITALAAGRIDIARAVGLRDDTIAQFKKPGYGMITEEGSQTSALYWNLGKEGALSDVRFRRACAMAIDRQDLVTRLAYGRGRPGNPGFLGPDNPFLAQVPQYPFDVAGANALLDAAGYRFPAGGGTRQGADGKSLSFELLISNVETPLSLLLVQSLSRIGVELKPKSVQIGVALFGTKYTGNFDIAVLFFPGPGPGGPNADPDVMRLLFSSRTPTSLQAATGYANPAFDDLAAKQLVTFDLAERKSIVAQMQKILADDLPVMTLYFPETALIFRKDVLDQWYFTPGQFPATHDNKQLFITGQKTGSIIRSIK